MRGLKGSLTRDVTSCIDKIKHFKSKYPTDDTETTSVQIDYVKDILPSLDCAQDRYTKLERALEELEMLLYDNWEDEYGDEHLRNFPQITHHMKR